MKNGSVLLQAYSKCRMKSFRMKFCKVKALRMFDVTNTFLYLMRFLVKNHWMCSLPPVASFHLQFCLIKLRCFSHVLNTFLYFTRSEQAHEYSTDVVVITQNYGDLLCKNTSWRFVKVCIKIGFDKNRSMHLRLLFIAFFIGSSSQGKRIVNSLAPS